VVWTGSEFAAVGDQYIEGKGYCGLVLTSPDGTAWSREAPVCASMLDHVVWTGTRLVGLGSKGVFTSPDGKAWKQTYVMPDGEHMSSMIWTGSQFVALGSVEEEGDRLFTSPDAVNWKAGKIPTRVGLNSIVWTGRQFVAVGYKATIVSSVDGSNWTIHKTGFKSDLQSIAWTGTRLVAVGYNGIILTAEEDSVLSRP
jgi:hypothetical protein